MGDYDERQKRGMEILEQMGREKTMLNQKALYPDLYDLSVGYLFGEIWSRQNLNLREREMVTMAANIALARPTGTQSHYHSALHIGITKEEIMELIIQVGMYAGWPTIALAVRQFTEVLEERARKVKEDGN